MSEFPSPRTSEPAQPGVTRVAGVDGCRGGWVVVLAEYDGAGEEPVSTKVRLCTSFAEVLALDEAPEIIAIDMPIGLLDRFAAGGRQCDQDARALLAPGWTSSVFSPPARVALDAPSHQEAMRRQGGGMSVQSFNIAHRIREVDAALMPEVQARVREAHPELAFRHVNGGAPLTARKHTEAGRRERIRLVRELFGEQLPDAMAARRRLGATAMRFDDVLDACVLAHVAWLIYRHEAYRVPAAEPPRDARNLRMEIWF